MVLSKFKLLSIGVNISKVYTMWIYMCAQSALHYVCLAVPNRQQPGVSTPNFNKTSPALWSNFHSHHFAYINNLYNIELGHKSHDECLIRNTKHWGTGRKVLLADCCITYTKIKPLKCKVVEPTHFSHKLIEYILVSSNWGKTPSAKLPHLFIFKFIMNVFNVMLRGMHCISNASYIYHFNIR